MKICTNKECKAMHRVWPTNQGKRISFCCIIAFTLQNVTRMCSVTVLTFSYQLYSSVMTAFRIIKTRECSLYGY